MAQSFFKIDGRQVFPKDWGDYGDILQHGMSMHRARQNEKISLERTGPYIPPITFPGAIVLTSEARTRLESSGLAGFTFLAVVKAHIAELPWETWDWNLDWPPILPESGEPEGYILDAPHSPSAADALGELWELILHTTGTMIKPDPITPGSLISPFPGYSFDAKTWNGADIFKAGGSGWVLCSERGRDWIAEHWGEIVRFDRFPST